MTSVNFLKHVQNRRLTKLCNILDKEYNRYTIKTTVRNNGVYFSSCHVFDGRDWRSVDFMPLKNSYKKVPYIIKRLKEEHNVYFNIAKDGDVAYKIPGRNPKRGDPSNFEEIFPGLRNVPRYRTSKCRTNSPQSKHERSNLSSTPVMKHTMQVMAKAWKK